MSRGGASALGASGLQDGEEGPVAAMAPELAERVPPIKEGRLGARPGVVQGSGPVDRKALGLPIPGVREDERLRLDVVAHACSRRCELRGDRVGRLVKVAAEDQRIKLDDVVGDVVPQRVRSD